MKGNEKIIEKLNQLLADELTAINQYMVHSEMCANWNYERLHETTEKRAVDVAKNLEGHGVAAIVFTDIQKDGMQAGPNLEETRRIAESVSIPIIASGGVANIDDIRAVADLEPAGVIGVITGRALYAGSLKLEEAVRAAKARHRSFP